MEKMPVATKDTISMTHKYTYQLPVIQSVNGKDMPVTMKNDIKTWVIVKNRPEKHKEKVKKHSCP